MVDLHVHTTFSDGQYTPSEIIAKAAKLNMKALAITDHDTTSGVREAALSGRDLFPSLTIIPGIELNIEWLAGECHLLGLGLKTTSPKLSAVIDTLKKMRVERNERIIKKLQDNGAEITLDDVTKKVNAARSTPADLISRVHIADYLTMIKFTKSKKVAFEKYLGTGGLCYERKHGVDLLMGLMAIKESGGVPVLAHPMSIYLSRGKLKEKLREFFQLGVMGLEAFHPSAKLGDCLWLEETGRELGYFLTAGSDFHGEAVRADRKLGYTCGDSPIDDKYYFSELLPALENR